jgi:hypothetical protein
MSYALSVDLRRCVAASVEEDGLTHRQGGECFKVSSVTLSRWRPLARGKGDVRLGPLAGDRNSWQI